MHPCKNSTGDQSPNISRLRRPFHFFFGSKQNDHQRPKHRDQNHGPSPAVIKQEPATTSITLQQAHQIGNPVTGISLGSVGVGDKSATVIGHYELKKTLGKGNFSTVKLAQHRITNHKVAIKIVKISVLNDESMVRVQREIEILKKLGKHENIVRLYQVIKTKRYFMLITEYCANQELYEFIVTHGRLSEPLACYYFRQITSALEYLHNHSIVHRDLKAENLLLTDNYRTIKLVDFGFANFFSKNRYLDTWCGSPPYAAPELFKGVEYAGPPADIWSLGVILYVLVCGSLPFDGVNLFVLKTRVLTGKFRIPFFMSDACENLVRSIIRLDPEKRLTTNQIRSHEWVTKSDNYFSGNNESKPVPMNIAVEESAKGAKPNYRANHRGTSLDFEDGKKNDPNQEEPSVMSLDEPKPGHSNSSSDPVSGVKDELSGISKFVDTEMLNAVSNMSIDSTTNSSMSVCQSTESNLMSAGKLSNRASQLRGAVAGSVSGRLSKESSLDDQIFEYMVDDLHVAISQSPIKSSVAKRKFDDLHAIYRLIKDQPEIIFRAKAANKFKIPALPIIPMNQQTTTSRPSIIRGVIEKPNKDNLGRVSDNDDVCMDHIDHSEKAISDNTIMSSSIDPSRDPSASLSENQTGTQNTIATFWNVPPQLFLTPPTDNQSTTTEQSYRTSQEQVDQYRKSTKDHTETFEQTPQRHSLDSNMYRLPDLQDGCNLSIIAGNIGCLVGGGMSDWDSSILDSLGLAPTQAIDTTGLDMTAKNARRSDDGHSTTSRTGTRSNIPRPDQSGILIGQLSDQVELRNPMFSLLDPSNPTLMLKHSLASSQSDQKDPKILPVAGQFTPNNLINQNLNLLNNFAVQNNLTNIFVPNISLLDPNCLTPGFERRASDGQASYNSLSSSKPEDLHDDLTFGMSKKSHKFVESIAAHPTQTQIGPLDLSVNSKTSALDMSPQSSSGNEDLTGRPSLSITSASASASFNFQTLPSSATTSPRSSCFTNSASSGNQSPISQVSPSSLSMTAGRPAHLLNKKKRHSLETEARHSHCQNNYHNLHRRIGPAHRGTSRTCTQLYPQKLQTSQGRNITNNRAIPKASLTSIDVSLWESSKMDVSWTQASEVRDSDSD